MDERTAQEPSAPHRADRVEIKWYNTHFVPLVIRNNWDYNIIKGTLVAATTPAPVKDVVRVHHPQERLYHTLSPTSIRRSVFFMTTETCYENFRTVLTLNLSSIIQDPETIKSVLDMVDMSMNDFEISKKPMEIIPVDGFPEVAKYFLASKGVANLSKNTLKQYRYKLIHFFDTVRKSYADVTANDIRIYLFNFKQERNASDCYVDNVRITLNSFF
jgi:hypothetical protein